MWFHISRDLEHSAMPKEHMWKSVYVRALMGPCSGVTTLEMRGEMFCVDGGPFSGPFS